MNSQEYELLIQESCEHLKQGRFRLALKSADKAYSANPEDERGICCYAKAKLENGFPDEAIELADSAVQSSGEDISSRICRAYILYRRGIYDSALADLKFIFVKDKYHYEALLLNARTLAALEKYSEAEEAVNFALNSAVLKDEAAYLKSLISICLSYNQKIFSRSVSKKDRLLEYAAEAARKKEYWFVLWASLEIIKDRKYSNQHKTARLLELEALLHTFRFREAFETAERCRNEYENDGNFNLLYRRILNKYPEGEKKTSRKPAGYSELFENNYFIVRSIRCYDFLRSLNRNKREYLVQFDEKEIRYVGVEVVIENPFYNNRDIDIEGTAVWYLNDIETGRYKFKIKLKKEWKVLDFVQSWGTNEPVFWKKGSGKVLIMLDEHPVCTKYFDIRDFEIPEEVELHQKSMAGPETEELSYHEDTNDLSSDRVEDENLENLLNDLNNLTGLDSVKQSLWDFVTYLRFINERKKHGLKTTEEISVHCVFTGNPGTGKTTVARRLGKIFKAMGILKSGHVVEVDRATLVGQYIGETAQKTEKMINEASGGILFIDEAYSLNKGASGQDFGQEAVDILLKRMEDKKDDFVVIVAGYPAKMQEFINSNPGLKSRFTHFFNFDDYTPDELITIFRSLASAEDYIITEDSIELLKKEFVRLFRKRDEHFGNARIAGGYLNSIKLMVSKRLSEGGEDLSREAFTLIIKEDLEKVFTEEGKKQLIYEIDEEKLEKLLIKLDNLTGLESVKKEINEIIKLTRYYIENGEDPQKNISGHLVFLGNPGTGKTTVARLFSEIYSALGILPKGHLVEVDRQALVGQYVGQTAIKTKDVIDSSIGGTLFIDEVYSLLKKDESDFGRESIDTLIKRMEDDKGKFILIAAGYTDETNEFLNINPGLSSRFYKSIKFEDYSPGELFLIGEKFFEERKFRLDEESASLLKKFLNEAYQKRDKRFGNARFIRNVTERIIRNHLLYLAGLSKSNRNNENTNIIQYHVVKEIIKEHKEWITGEDSGSENILMELEALTGQKQVKELISKIVSGIKVSGLRERRGFKSVPKILHSVFYGNPGTGKLTTARIFGSICRKSGVLSSGHIVIANKLNMTAPYIGQSKVKTSELIQKAKGGLLYIEDAEFLESDLVQGSEIMEAMLEVLTGEHNDLIIILSANNYTYIKEVKKNQFLSKYFVNYFHFEDFTPRELVEIAYSIAEMNSYSFDEGALQHLMDVFSDLLKKKMNTENAKMVKDILYRAISVQEERLASTINPSDEDLTIITFEDVKKASGFIV